MVDRLGVMVQITDARFATLTRLIALPRSETPTIIDDEGATRIGLQWSITTIHSG